MLRTVLVVVTHVAFHLTPKPLEVVEDRGHQYWSTLWLVHSYDSHPMRTIHAILVTIVSTSCAFVTPPPPSRRKIPSDAFVTDAEIKHGRVALVSGAMLAALASAGIEHPTVALSQCSIDTQLEFFSAIGLAEAATYLPRLSSMFSLRDDAVPGKLIPMVKAETWLTKTELNVTRVAMLVVFLYMLYDVSR